MQDIIDYTTTQPNSTVSYFYFDYKETKKQTLKNAVRSLVLQLALQLPDCFQKLEALYRSCKEGHQQPAEGDIRTLLTNATSLGSRNYIILDALDECLGRQELFAFIQNSLSLERCQTLLLATSRRERDIEENLTPFAKYVINAQSAVIDEDIRLYVEDRLSMDPKLKKWPAEVKTEISTVIMKEANGMYDPRLMYCFLRTDDLENQVSLGVLSA